MKRKAIAKLTPMIKLTPPGEIPGERLIERLDKALTTEERRDIARRLALSEKDGIRLARSVWGWALQ